MKRAPQPYRRRLRVEGGALAACGLLDVALLLRARRQASRWPLNTLAQLAAVAALVVRRGPRRARELMAASVALSPGHHPDGDPTPLWQLPLLVAALTAALVSLPKLDLPGSQLAGWDAGVRIGGGCAIVGLGQAVLIARTVAENERLTGRTYYRLPAAAFATTLAHRTTPG